MAEVYRARQINLDRQVAIKIMSEEFIESFEGDEEEILAALKRFHREVMVMAQVRHANVLQVYDQDRAVLPKNGKELNIEYIVMEYIPGPNLRSTMPPEGLRGSEKKIREWIRNYFFPILEGVETVHALGIVHRDLKPENVLLEEGIVPKIMDFGLAGGARWRGLTQSHHMFGTIQYMATEQFMDMGETDVRGDVYSLGKMLYEAVAGEMVKEKAFPLKTARLSNPDTPFLKRLDRIIQQATAEDKNQRIPSAKVLREALETVLEEEEESALRIKEPSRGFRIWRPRLLMAALMLIAAVSIGFHILYHREKAPLPIQPTPSSLSGSTQGQVPGKEETEAPYIMREGLASPTLKGRDGATMRLIPAGEVELPRGVGQHAEKSMKVAPFYMDETEVTNHQYVEFLNQVLSEIQVERGVVKGDGQIWVLLGEVVAGYEPIVFRDGRFFLKDPALASHPVVRVTGQGAAAYAGFYGRRLPTDAEWLIAASGEESSETPVPEASESSGQTLSMEKMHGQMHSSPSNSQAQWKRPVPVVHFKPNVYGIRGLNRNVKEWGLRAPTRDKEAPIYVIVGGIEGNSGQAPSRHSWEAFEDVGFRCALSMKNPTE
jgi:serine/threonine-protein kinase